MRYFASLFEEDKEFTALLSALSGEKSAVSVTGLEVAAKAYLAFLLTEVEKRPLLYIAADENEANRVREMISSLAGKNVSYFPMNDYAIAALDTRSHEWEHARISALCNIQAEDREDGCPLCVTTPDAICRPTLPPENLRALTVTLRVSEDVPLEQVTRALVEGDYTRTALIEGAGQFSVRGGILDFFPPQEENPYRIEFFGDTIDTISRFDLSTQRRTEEVEEVEITPTCETVLSPENRKALAETLLEMEAAEHRSRRKNAEETADTLAKDASLLRDGLPLRAPDRYLSILFPEMTTLFDYLPPHTIVMVSESVKQSERLRAFSALLSEDIKASLEAGAMTPKMAKDLSLSPAGFWAECEKFSVLFADLLPTKKLPVPPTFLSNFVLRQGVSAGGNFELLLSEVRAARAEKNRIAILCGSERRARNMADVLQGNDLPAVLCSPLDVPPASGIGIYELPFPAALSSPALQLSLFSDGANAGPRRKKRRALHKNAGERIRTYADLRVGDYVVHASYGVGQYLGIQKMTVEGVTRDYIKIQYAGTDALYVPAGQLDLLSKYISAGEKGSVKLNKMGGGDWERTKSRVKKAVADMADELIRLYAERSEKRGFAFSEDNEWQKEFEARFEYDETEDQLRCIREIKEDMQSTLPMERLLCGDVGFGKTEVALRAAFKCVLDGKQCALLVPTTILAQQHYETILRRFAGYPIKVDVLSRFRSPKQQQQTLRELGRGEVDLVVGTHRLLQKDVHFKDLGLVIIDEEQRFGVTHKEKLKDMTKNVDSLTLTATPIPRTLNMALSGIRDMSVIEEAPHNRTPVQTYVTPQDNGMIAEAIRRELRRGGQVFYLHNRVDSIQATAARLKKLVPEAVIDIGHGKMNDEELSDVWEGVVRGETDVLVCTTIIETGVDIPNANTLIIEDADKLGLSQLYQIRGRVGRSDKRAYVYFTYRQGRVLTDDAAKRLAAIREFTEFNSGFKIALRDLEIRGAGNLLGAEQHGHMESVGYDMYVRLLEEAVAEKRGEQKSTKVECSVDLFIDAHIPPSYVESTEQRMDIYKKIAGISTDDDLSDIFDELCDRYGDLPRSVENLCRIALLRGKAGALGISAINHKGDMLQIDAVRLGLPQVGRLMNEGGRGIYFSAGKTPEISVKLQKGEDVLSRLSAVLALLEEEKKKV